MHVLAAFPGFNAIGSSVKIYSMYGVMDPASRKFAVNVNVINSKDYVKIYHYII